jgi:SnoaL-like protein
MNRKDFMTAGCIMTGTMRTSRIVVAGILTVALLAPLGAQSDSARLKRLEDVQEIQTLLLNYGRTLDARDFRAYSLLFAKDGVWSGGMGTVQGPVAIQAFMERDRGATTTRWFARMESGSSNGVWRRMTFPPAARRPCNSLGSVRLQADVFNPV